MTTRQMDTDVVVAGAGAAGLAAAIRAADGGATVALLEASATFRQGSNTSMSTSMIPVADSRWQQAKGITDDSNDLLYDDIMHKTRGQADPAVAKALVEVGRELADFLAEDCDIPLELADDVSFPGHSRRRHLCVHDRAGRTLHRHLLEAADKRENITMVMPWRVTGLTPVTLDSGGDGWVVTAESPDGTVQKIVAGAVVLATNGFGANTEMVARHIPEVAEGLYFGGDHSLGDAIRIGETLGADTAFLDSYQGHGSVATPHGVLLTWTTVMNGAFLVNVNGERFGDESTGYSEYAVQVIAQPGATAWVVYDQAIHERALPFADYQQLIEADGIRWVDDTAGLAGVIGCEEAAIAATLGLTEQYAEGTATDPLGRTSWPRPLQPPYAAVKVSGALFHTQGGLAIDGRANVLSDGRPMPGLYAAGGAAAGISGHGATGYLSGNGLLSALGLGYLAGKAITGG
ncbi:MAG: FAD-binding protein [Acidimicrobiia bacterium]|nr:FAD-binding protein [Acidimicrobiia bacterium]